MKSQSLKILLEPFIVIDKAFDVKIKGITNNSRLVKKGDLFIACKGDTFDARTCIEDVVQKGAVAVLYQQDDNETLTINVDVPTIGLQNLPQIQGDIAARFYGNPTHAMDVVGVTGTNGKTSCTRFIAEALEKHKRKCAVIGTMGSGFLPKLAASQHTTPDAVTLQKQLHQLKKARATCVAMEVSSHALSQHRVSGVAFDIAVLTQLSRDHLDYHGTMEAYADAKAQLFAWPTLRAAVINADDALGQRLIAACSDRAQTIAYSTSSEKLNIPNLIHARLITPTQTGFHVEVESPWGSGAFESNLLGRFNVSNCLAVLATLILLEVPLNQALKDISHLRTVPGRMELFGDRGTPKVVVDYSHTPDALEKALQALREHCSGELWCVFGCGGDRDPGKRPQMARIAEQYSDQVIVTNDNPRNESPDAIAQAICSGFTDPASATVLLDRLHAIAMAVKSAQNNDIVLVAGKGHEVGQIMKDRVIPFNDGEHVQQQLRLKRSER